MKGRIDNLKTGLHYNEDGSILCKICRSDNGVHIEFADFDANFFYAVTINEENKAKFEMGLITETKADDNRKDDHGQD